MKNKLLRRSVISLIVLTLILAGGAYWITSADGDGRMRDVLTATSASNLDLGISYMTLTPGLASYYDLGTDGGALVTRVIEDGLADQLGIESGEVIVKFNNAPLGGNVPLLGMMRGCHAGHTVVLDIWSEEGYRSVEFKHK